MIKRGLLILFVAGSAMADDAGVPPPDAAIWPDAATSPCGNGVLDQSERCDIAIGSGSGACPTAPQCALLPAGSLGGGCNFYLTGSDCEAHCVAASFDCDGGETGSGSGSGSGQPKDDGSCSVGRSNGALALAAIALALMIANRPRRR